MNILQVFYTFKIIGLLLFVVNITTASEVTTNISQNYGNNIELKCQSSVIINCNWKRNSIPVLIFDRYSYKSGNGKNTTDCSITIELFHEIDSGLWSCSSLADDDLHLISYSINSISHLQDVFETFPENITTSLNNDVHIRCKFNIRINECVWLRNQQPLVITGRYRFTNNEEGLYSTDCSISISKIQLIDAGMWQCASPSNFRTGYLKSNPFYLTINGQSNFNKMLPKVSIMYQPETNFTRIGSSTKLTCIFNETVDRCEWLRNDEKMTIEYRYQFTESERGKFTKDCSIEISNVKIFDIATWQCLSAATNTEDAVKSNKISLFDPDVTGQTNIGIKTSSENITVAVGRSAIFICTFDVDVYCNWEKNGKRVSIDKNYAYFGNETGINTKNCSILIMNVSSSDVGQWTCSNMASPKLRNVQMANFHLNLIPQRTPTYPIITYNNQDIEELLLYAVDLSSNVTCTSQFGYPAPQLYWKINGHKIHNLTREENGDDEKGSYNSTLNWNIASEMYLLDNVSELQCIAEHPLFLQPKIATLPIKRTKTPKKPLILNSNSVVHENESLSVFGNDYLQCSSTGGFPAPSLKWFLNGQEIRGFQNITKNEDQSYDVTLKWEYTYAKFIENATELHCELSHPDFKERIATLVKIDDFETLSEPTIKFNTTSINELNITLLQENVDLNCRLRFKRKYPTTKYVNLYWELNGSKIPGRVQIRNDNNSGNSIELRWLPSIQNRTTNNATELTCVAEYMNINKLRKSSLKLVHPQSDNYDAPTDPIVVTSTSYAILISICIIGLIVVAILIFFTIRKRKQYKWKVPNKHLADLDHQTENVHMVQLEVEKKPISQSEFQLKNNNNEPILSTLV